MKIPSINWYMWTTIIPKKSEGELSPGKTKEKEPLIKEISEAYNSKGNLDKRGKHRYLIDVYA